eukprot:scaffold1669_cov129-Cylindrotheca_fusiformis.AAC.41
MSNARKKYASVELISMRLWPYVVLNADRNDWVIRWNCATDAPNGDQDKGKNVRLLTTCNCNTPYRKLTFTCGYGTRIANREECIRYYTLSSSALVMHFNARRSIYTDHMETIGTVAAPSYNNSESKAASHKFSSGDAIPLRYTNN